MAAVTAAQRWGARSMASEPAQHPRTLVIARHFPPSVRGIQTFTEQMLRRLDPDRIVLVTTQPERDVQSTTTFPVVRTTLARLRAELPRARPCQRLHRGLASVGNSVRRAGTAAQTLGNPVGRRLHTWAGTHLDAFRRDAGRAALPAPSRRRRHLPGWLHRFASPAARWRLRPAQTRRWCGWLGVPRTPRDGVLGRPAHRDHCLPAGPAQGPRPTLRCLALGAPEAARRPADRRW